MADEGGRTDVLPFRPTMESSRGADEDLIDHDSTLVTGEPQYKEDDQSTALIQKAVKAYQVVRNTCNCAVGRARSLQLLDLPVDVLKEIVKEITHTNDLTALALTHPALHELVIAPIYSRFDIVWPDVNGTSDPRTGVDALTYGLSTLVMSRDVFRGGRPEQSQETTHTCSNCGHVDKSRISTSSHYQKRRRKGNNYAQYTRKFSLGNGPPEWVQEYLISKESGKMLGTLVALAVSRMTNLESFIWDMPTGIVRDVWDTLSSLADREDGTTSRLESIWVRCHDSKRTVTSTNPDSSHNPQSHSIGTHRSLNKPQGFLAASFQRIEHPNFSILPPLKSIAVLDIDELAYLEELSALVESSVDCLRELRIGSAKIWHAKNWPPAFKEASQNEFDPVQGHASADGMLGILMRRLYSYKHRTRPVTDVVSENIIPLNQTAISSNIINDDPSDPGTRNNLVEPQVCIGACQLQQLSDVAMVLPAVANFIHRSDCPMLAPDDQLDDISFTNALQPQETNVDVSRDKTKDPDNCASKAYQGLVPKINSQQIPNWSGEGSHEKGDTRCFHNRKRLRLQVLELERIALGIDVLKKTIEWKVLTSLTLLNCESDEDLWKVLRRVYTPRPNISAHSFSKTSSPPLEYSLNLKRIRTNNVSASLIAFLKETLAPNTLECMILQDNYTSSPNVTIETILRGPLKRHRSSLKKVMIDSADRTLRSGRRASHWKKWAFTREVIAFVTSGKMTALRELAMAIDYKDWVCSCSLYHSIRLANAFL